MVHPNYTHEIHNVDSTLLHYHIDFRFKSSVFNFSSIQHTHVSYLTFPFSSKTKKGGNCGFEGQ